MFDTVSAFNKLDRDLLEADWHFQERQTRWWNLKCINNSFWKLRSIAPGTLNPHAARTPQNHICSNSSSYMYSRTFLQLFAEDENVLTKHHGPRSTEQCCLNTEHCYVSKVIENDIDSVIDTFAKRKQGLKWPAAEIFGITHVYAEVTLYCFLALH